MKYFKPALPLLAMIISLIFITQVSAAEKSRILVFGDSNTWGWSPIAKGFPATRFSDETRWAGILDAALPEAKVIVDGMVGRRSDIDSGADNGLVSKEDFNGAKALPASIARNMPLDLVIIMLGTNDLQAGTERTPTNVAKAVFKMAEQVTQSNHPIFTAYNAPKILIVGPAALGDTSKTPLSGLFQVAEEPSKQLGMAFKAEATRTGIAFFDASSVTNTDGIDGIHFNTKNHERLGSSIAPAVRTILLNDDKK